MTSLVGGFCDWMTAAVGSESGAFQSPHHYHLPAENDGGQSSSILNPNAKVFTPLNPLAKEFRPSAPPLQPPPAKDSIPCVSVRQDESEEEELAVSSPESRKSEDDSCITPPLEASRPVEGRQATPWVGKQPREKEEEEEEDETIVEDSFVDADECPDEDEEDSEEDEDDFVEATARMARRRNTFSSSCEEGSEFDTRFVRVLL